MRSILSYSLVALVVSASLACGFQLRTEADVPAAMQSTYLQIADPGSDFARGLERSLQRAGVTLVDDISGATATLYVPQNQISQEILSIGANSRVREFSIRHNVTFRLLDSKGNELIPSQHLELTRPLSFDESEILASSREQEFVRQELAQTMVRQVMLRLAQVSVTTADADNS